MAMARRTRHRKHPLVLGSCPPPRLSNERLLYNYIVPISNTFITLKTNPSRFANYGQVIGFLFLTLLPSIGSSFVCCVLFSCSNFRSLIPLRTIFTAEPSVCCESPLGWTFLLRTIRSPVEAVSPSEPIHFFGCLCGKGTTNLLYISMRSSLDLDWIFSIRICRCNERIIRHHLQIID